MKKQYVVRIVQVEEEKDRDIIARIFDNPPIIPHSFIESLRYAGLATVHETDPNGLTTDCFDLICPNGLDSKLWAEQNAERMRTFGYNAVCAPINLIKEKQNDNCSCNDIYFIHYYHWSYDRKNKNIINN